MKRRVAVFGSDAAIGTLGGLIGLGGAEFRLPLLIGVFRFAALEAVVLNKAISLVVVASALIFRTRNVSCGTIALHWDVIVNLLAGSLLGAWAGADLATRIKSESLYKIISVLLGLIAVVLLFMHNGSGNGQSLLTGAALIGSGVVAGLGIGVFASFLGVAGGELLIPTIVLLYGADIKLAGSLSLAVSLPTMITGFARYSRDSSFSVLAKNKEFVLLMASGSFAGAFLGGMLLGIIPSKLLIPILTVVLAISAVKVWRHS